MAKIYCRDRLLWDRVSEAAHPFARFLGLMGRRSLSSGEGLMIVPCAQVHMFHMKFPLDVLFLSMQMQVLRIVTLSPGRISPWVKDAVCVLEVKAGTAQQWGVLPGDTLMIEHEI
jgi:uncharacterized membrane protein (UPF0127 family)